MRTNLFLEIVGEEDFPRFLITDNNSRYWTGTDWSKNKKEGKLYHEAEEAAQASQQVLREAYKDCQHAQIYEVPVLFEVLSKEPVSPEMLRVWAQRATYFAIQYGAYGNGPSADTLVLAKMDFNQFRPCEKR